MIRSGFFFILFSLLDFKHWRKHKKIPKKQGLSQEDFAQKSGVKYTTLTKIESGVIKKPSVLVIAKIAKALKISVKNLLKIMVMTGKFEQFRGENPHENESSAQEGAGQGLSREEKAELQGNTFFRDNPIAADLLTRSILERTTPKEEAKLDGYFIFRDNPRAADLLTKLFLGKITEKEREELEKYFQEYFQRKKFSPGVNSLWNKVKARNPNVKQVDMNQGKALKFSPGDDEKIK